MADAQYNHQDFTNFAGNVHLVPQRTYFPESVEHLVGIVQQAEMDGKHVRAYGSGWSFTKVNATEDYLVSTERLNKILSDTMTGGPTTTDPVFRSILPSVVSSFRTGGCLSGGLVHVQAGIQIRDLYCRLSRIPQPRPCAGVPNGFALPTLGGAGGQTLAGAISTSTHGGDKDLPPLPDMVRGIHLVSSKGRQWFFQKHSMPIVDVVKLVQFSPGLGRSDVVTNDDVFNAVLVSMGRMGIIHSLVIQVRQQFNLEETTFAQEWSEVREKIELWRLAPNLRFLQILMSPYSPNKCFVTWRNEIPATAPEPCPPPTGGDDVREIRTPADFLTWWCLQDAYLAKLIYDIVANFLGSPELVADTIGPCSPAGGLISGIFGGPLGLATSAAVCHAKQTLLPETFGINSKSDESIGDMIDKALGLISKLPHGYGVKLAGDIINAVVARSEGTKTGVSYAIMDIHEYRHQCYTGLSMELAFDATQRFYLEFLEWLQDQIASWGKDEVLFPCFISLRYCGASDALLAIQQWDSTVCIEIGTLKGDSTLAGMMRVVEDKASELGAAVHWGQMNTRSRHDIKRLFGPRLDLWRATLWHLSGLTKKGHRTFANDFCTSHGLDAISSTTDLLRDAFPSFTSVSSIPRDAFLDTPEPLPKVFLGSGRDVARSDLTLGIGPLIGKLVQQPLVKVPGPIPPGPLTLREEIEELVDTDYQLTPLSHQVIGQLLKPSLQFQGPVHVATLAEPKCCSSSFRQPSAPHNAGVAVAKRAGSKDQLPLWTHTSVGALLKLSPQLSGPVEPASLPGKCGCMASTAAPPPVKRTSSPAPLDATLGSYWKRR